MDKKQNISKSVYIVLAAALFIFALWKTRIGIHSDEIHSLAVGDMIARGNLMFKDCWFYLQLSSVLSAPLAAIYHGITGSNDGIILYYRIIAVLIQSGVAVYFYKTFATVKNRLYVFIASVCMFSFVADFLNFGYKPEMVWFTTLEICYAYSYFVSKKVKNLVYLGIALSLCVLCFPTTVLQAVAWIMLLMVYNREDGSVLRKVWVIPVTCLACAAAFFIFVFSQISVADFIKYFPEILNDDQLASNFLTKLIRPIIKIAEIGVLSIVPVLICAKIKFFGNIVRRFKIPVISCLLILAFLGQCYIERAGFTWHCITYPYSLTMYLLPAVYYLSSEEEKKDNKWMYRSFTVMAWISFLCISLASNQGNITCIYAGVFSTCGLLVLLGNNSHEDRYINAVGEKKTIAYALVVMAMLMYLFPVWDQEAIYSETYGSRNIFSKRVLMTEGPAKGIYVGDDMYNRVTALCEAVDKYVTPQDKVYIIENGFYTSFGYMHQKGEYAVYSPRGHYYERIAQYYETNPEKLASVIIISKQYIKERFDETFPEGKALQKIIDDNNFVRIEDDNFIVYKR